jgi:periplasmic protein TonB
MTSDPREEQIPLATPFTLVIWMGCLAVGLGGDRPESPPPSPSKIQSPVQAVMLNVEIAKSTQLPLMTGIAPAPAVATLPQTPAPSALLQLTPLNPIFAQTRPATLPIRQVTAQRPPVVQQLTLGQGEGRQPSPEYPREAQIDGEEGTVVVRFNVDTEGSVRTVQAISPCRWPLLNQSALRAVRDTWRFAPGPPRLYEVRIRFEISHPR